MPSADTKAELSALTDQFFGAVSFQLGQSPTYTRLRELFMDDGKLIRNSSELPEISSLEEFIASRQAEVDSGELTSFSEVETAETTESFGNIAHRLSTYEKRATMPAEAMEGRGVISIQFIHTPNGWRISSMAWDDERPGLAIPDRYR